MFIDQPACAAFWRDYLARLPADHPHHEAKPDAFGFGGEPALADELVQLALFGAKRATTSLPAEFSALSEPLPRAGGLSIIVRGDGQPVALIERTSVRSVPFSRVDEQYAAIQGEGDGSLLYWRAVHLAYFTGVCARLGGAFMENTEVLCQVFRVIWPRPRDA